MANTISKLNPEWIRETRQYFLDFLELTKFPHPERNGRRGSSFDYPEWLIMFIAVLAVKCREKTYPGMHRMTEKYWSQIADGLDQRVISESQLRERLKKICHEPGKPTRSNGRADARIDQRFVWIGRLLDER